MLNTDLSTFRRTCVGCVFAAVLALAFPMLANAGAYEDFFRAVKVNDAKSVKSLLARGFDPNTIDEQRRDTGLILSLREDAMDVFGVLLNAPGTDMEARAQNGDNALMIACYKGNVRAAKELIAKGAQVNRVGWTPLHYAAAVGNNEIVQLLLDNHAYIDAESPNKTTPLMMASWEGHIMTVKLLHDQGADARLKNEAGLTAIDFAEKFGHPDIAEGLAYRLNKVGQR